MTRSHRRGRFDSRFVAVALLAASIVAPAGVTWADPPANAADEPPEPPVARNDEYYPISYRSFATDISDDREAHAKNGERQGTMTWSEWWYSYDRVDYTYLVGIGLLTITPISPSFTNWSALEDFSVDLAHEAQGCTYQASKPDENGPGIQLSAGLTITADGPELGGGASWGVRVDGVSITDVAKDGQRVSWTADISDGSATASGGVNDLLFFGEWRCPKGMDFTRTHLLGVGSFELDDWGPGDTEYVFGGNGSLDTMPSTGSSAPLDGSSRGYWRFDPDKDHWVHMPDYYDRKSRQASKQAEPKSNVSGEEGFALRMIGGLLTKPARTRDRREPTSEERVSAIPAADRQVEGVKEAAPKAPQQATEKPPQATNPPATGQPKESAEPPRMPASETGYAGTPDARTSCQGSCAKPATKGRICAESSKKAANRCEISEPKPK